MFYLWGTFYRAWTDRHTPSFIYKLVILTVDHHLHHVPGPGPGLVVGGGAQVSPRVVPGHVREDQLVTRE